MVTKLKLALQTPYLPLLLNTALFGALLFWFAFGSHGLFASIFFVCVAWYCYSRSLFKHIQLWGFFLVLLALALATPIFVPQYVWFLLPLLIVSWAILIGLERLLLVDRNFFLYILGIILLLVAILFYIAFGERMGISGFFGATAFVAIASLLFDGVLTTVPDPTHRTRIVSLVGALLLFELVWALSLLPFGVFTVLILGFLFGTSFIDFFVRMRHAPTKYSPLFLHTLIFIVFAVLVSLTTQWRL